MRFRQRGRCWLRNRGCPRRLRSRCLGFWGVVFRCLFHNRIDIDPLHLIGLFSDVTTLDRCVRNAQGNHDDVAEYGDYSVSYARHGGLCFSLFAIAYSKKWWRRGESNPRPKQIWPDIYARVPRFDLAPRHVRGRARRRACSRFVRCPDARLSGFRQSPAKFAYPPSGSQGLSVGAKFSVT